MYITINDIIGKKTIDLSYPIHPTTKRGEARKEIAVVSMHSNNAQILLHRSIEVLLKMNKKIVLNKGVYMHKELNSLIAMELKSQMLDSRNDILRTNKLVNGTKISISLNKLDNSDNLEDGKTQQHLIYIFCGTSYLGIKMYITINNIKGEKRIDLSYSIQNFDSDKEITVVRTLSNNVQYQY